MSQIIKAFTGIFFILFMVLTATGLLSAFLQTVHAQNLHGAIIDELENSDYARVVLEEIFVVTEEAGYEIAITLYDSREGVISCDDMSNLPTDCNGISMAEIILKYPIQIPFLGVDVKQELFGYAR